MLHKLSKHFSLILLLQSLQLIAMDHTSTMPTPAIKKCLEAYAAEYQNEIDATLIEVTLHQKHPMQLLDALINYHTQSSYPRRLSIIFKKMKAYTQLSRDLTKEICAPAAAGLTPEESEDPDKALQEFYDLKQEVWNREWPLISVDCDLDAVSSTLDKLKDSLQKSKEKLTLIEQQSINDVEKDLNAQSNAVKKAREIIQKRLIIYEVKQDPINFLYKQIKMGHLEKKLSQLKSVYPIQTINDDFKQKDPEQNSLLHALPRTPLTGNELSYAIKLLTESDGLNINSLNKSKNTVLDEIEKDKQDDKAAFRAIIKTHGGKNGKAALKLKWTDEQQPNSPEREAKE